MKRSQRAVFGFVIPQLEDGDVLEALHEDVSS